MHHSTARLPAAIQQSPRASSPGGGALLPSVLAAVVLHLGAMGRRPAIKLSRLKPAAERFIASTRRDLPQPAVYER